MVIKGCGNCAHFRLHYIRLAKGRYHALRYGHCVYPRRKQREAFRPACPHWKAREDGADGSV